SAYFFPTTGDPGVTVEWPAYVRQTCITFFSLVIMRYRPECLPAQVGGMDTLISRWVTWLPIWEDGDETEYVYSYLCDLVEANNPAALGANNASLVRIVSAIARVLSEKGLPRPGDPEREDQPTKFAQAQEQQRNGVNGAKAPSVYERCVAILRLVRRSFHFLIYSCYMCYVGERQRPRACHSFVSLMTVSAVSQGPFCLQSSSTEPFNSPHPLLWCLTSTAATQVRSVLSCVNARVLRMSSMSCSRNINNNTGSTH
ncbi:unnamed protein product, partial [Schistocephalus solidus]|uniref:Rho-GAP domain-containing protein n=1 Tax=Schistocephalus solidus TaxID=70667 RepID=A0A183S9P7_SCHSO